MMLFMGFIVTLVSLMIKPHKADSLIETDYYERGQAYDRDYNAIHDAKEDQMVPAIKTSEKDLTIVFPNPVTYTIILRNLANADMDRTFKSDSSSTEAIIPRRELKQGAWLLRIGYKSGLKEYLYQDKIKIP